MKFTIRFADQVVGALIVAALGALVFVVVMLGGKHRWFAQDFLYTAYLDTATGLNPNMAVQFKGFTIGNVKSFDLTDDNRVQVIFSVYDTYRDRVREGSLVELAVAPLGLGSHFYFYPGRGDRLLEERETIPLVNSPEAQQFQIAGLSDAPKQDDSITLLLANANNLLPGITRTLDELEKALRGTDASSLGRIIGNIEKILQDVDRALEGTDASSLGRIVGNTEKAVQGVGETVDGLPRTINDTLEALLRDIEPALANLRAVSDKLADPEGLVLTALDGEGYVSTNLRSSLDSVAGVLRSVEKTAAALPSEMSQVAGLLEELRKALKSAQDVLEAVSNNPLLKKGIPPPVKAESTGASSRDISF